LFWQHRSPTSEPSRPNNGFSETPHNYQKMDSSENIRFDLVALPVILFLITGLFLGAFSVALLFRRIAIALAIIGPLLFSAIWILHDWKSFHGKRFALGAFAAGFTLTFLALDREP
jgi:hypothetical protein